MNSNTSVPNTTTTIPMPEGSMETKFKNARLVPLPQCTLLGTSSTIHVAKDNSATRSDSEEPIQPQQTSFSNYEAVQTIATVDYTPSSSGSLAPFLQAEKTFPETNNTGASNADLPSSNPFPLSHNFEPYSVPSETISILKRTQHPILRWWYFGTNIISTTRYNLITFIPLNLFEQFLRISNLFFLLIVILQFIPGLSPLGNLSTIFPFVFVILISACRAAWDDLKRWISDLKVNARKVQVWNSSTNQFQTKKWRQVKIGDVILVEENQVLPADVLLLTCQSSISKNRFVFVETADLDGETNLKVKKCVWKDNFCDDSSQFDSQVSHLLSHFWNGFVQTEYPSPNLQSFQGKVYLLNSNQQVRHEQSISQDHMLWRGTILRNTDKALGLVLYTGHQTKILKNRNRTPHKISRVEKFINRYIFAWILFIFGLSLLCTVGDVIYDFTLFKTTWYLQTHKSSSLWITYVRDFLSFLILFNTLLPIILYASMDLGLFFQSLFMQADKQMDNCHVKNTNLNGELGQVSYLFSDKTGTLTKNRMHLVHLCINGTVYGTVEKEESLHSSSDQETEAELFESKFEDAKLINGNWRHQMEENPMLEHGLRILCIANSVTPVCQSGDRHVQYYYTSSDEYAFVLASKKIGLTLLRNSLDTITLEYNDSFKQHSFQILATIPFHSERARFTCIVKDLQTDSIYLYCKGSDHVILPKVKESFKQQIKWYQMIEALQRFANQGYRTMVFAVKQLTTAEISNIPSDPVECEEWMNQLEMGMELIGVTAVEDELQDKVNETIQKCTEAGIKVWIVSGDKKETALSVAHSVQLLASKQQLLTLQEESQVDLLRQELMQLVKNPQITEELKQKCFVIHGHQFAVIQSDPKCSKLFFYLAAQCASGIGCRMTPMQKSMLVKGMKQQTNQAICLAIGDGSNDISMLNVAHVGVGLVGKEGMQASRAADYSIKQFHYLQRLLLVHGRWNYQRISLMMLYNCYKSIVLYGAQVFFAFYSGFSQSSIHERWMLSIYTQILTLIPIVVNGTLDQDVEDTVVLQNPKLYKEGPRNKHFNKIVFILWMIDSVLHCSICFFFPLYILENANQFLNGRTFDINATGVTIYACVMSVVQVKLVLESRSITIFHVLGYLISVAAWFIAVLFLSNFWLIHPTDAYPYREFYKSVDMHLILGEPLFYLTVLLTTIVSVFIDILWKSVVGGDFWKGPLFSCLYCKRINQ